MVTDYSSTMFDFAITGKPMLFYTYDLEHYRDALRGFYFDIEADAPGPLVRTTGQLVDAIADLDAVQRRYDASYARFRSRFCHLEDGLATERVVDWLLGLAATDAPALSRRTPPPSWPDHPRDRLRNRGDPGLLEARAAATAAARSPSHGSPCPGRTSRAGRVASASSEARARASSCWK